MHDGDPSMLHPLIWKKITNANQEVIQEGMV